MKEVETRYGNDGGRIDNSEFSTIGNMVCNECGKKVDGHYLCIYHYDSRRGNEDDFYTIYHRECSNDHPKWLKHDQMKKEKQAPEELVEKFIEQSFSQSERTTYAEECAKIAMKYTKEENECVKNRLNEALLALEKCYDLLKEKGMKKGSVAQEALRIINKK